MPGWSESTVGATSVEQLPENAVNYIKRLEQLIECPIDIISTGQTAQKLLYYVIHLMLKWLCFDITLKFR